MCLLAKIDRDPEETKTPRIEREPGQELPDRRFVIR
jgi:hypothetical protein